MKFLADSSLGRLSTWLRILGYDTVYWRGAADRVFLRVAERQGRAVLTRRKDVLARQHPGIVLFVENDRVEDQIVEVLGKLDLRPEQGKLFTLCLRCNDPWKKPHRMRCARWHPNMFSGLKGISGCARNAAGSSGPARTASGRFQCCEGY